VTDVSDTLRKDLTTEEFERFRDWIHHHSGIYLEESKFDSLRISLVTRATRHGFVEYGDYFDVLSHNEDEFKELMNLVTINETSFFRFPAQFDALREHVIPELLHGRDPRNQSFRVWSAGCSTGEEPYSIAMTLLDSEAQTRQMRCEVLGTDVSTQALERAKLAVYPAKSLTSLPQTSVQRWFEAVRGGHRPVDAVRQIVGFAYHNLIKEPYPTTFSSNWDIIFCRNVTIYFRPESTRRVVDNFYEALNPGGFLFIGHSETLTSISQRFEPVEIGGVFLYRKPRDRSVFAGGFEPTVRPVRTPRPRTAELPRPHPVPARERPKPAPAPEPVPPRASVAPVASTVEAEKFVAEARELLEQGEPRKARAMAELALATDARNIPALLVRAHAGADTGDLASAIADANAALAVDPLLAQAHYILGIIHLRQEDAHRATSEFKRTIYVDRDFVLAHFNLANIYRAQGDFDDACREYENTLRALYVNPQGEWTAFLGGFKPDLLAKTCERSLIECRKGSTRS